MVVANKAEGVPPVRDPEILRVEFVRLEKELGPLLLQFSYTHRNYKNCKRRAPNSSSILMNSALSIWSASGGGSPARLICYNHGYRYTKNCPV